MKNYIIINCSFLILNFYPFVVKGRVTSIYIRTVHSLWINHYTHLTFSQEGFHNEK